MWKTDEGEAESIVLLIFVLKKKTNFIAPFYGWGSTASRLEPLRGGSLLFTTKFPEISGTLAVLYSSVSEKLWGDAKNRILKPGC